MTLVISLNGTDLASQNIYVGGTINSWQGTTPAVRTFINAPGRTAGTLSASSDVAPRTFVLPLYGNTNTLAARVASMDWIKQWQDQQVTIRMADGTTTRELIGVVQQVDAVSVVTANNPVWRGALTLVAPDPTWRDTADTTVGSIGSSPVALTLGSAPSEDWNLSITVSGGSDPRTITVTFGGTVSSTCTWTGSFAGHTLVADASNDSVLLNGVTAIATWSGGFPGLDPRNGTVTIAVSSSSGTATGVLVYRPRRR